MLIEEWECECGGALKRRGQDYVCKKCKSICEIVEMMEPSTLYLRAPVSRNREVFLYAPSDFTVYEMNRLKDYLGALEQALIAKEDRDAE